MEVQDKKVIFVTGGLTDGGAEKVMSILASQCAEMGADVTLVILREKERTYPISDNVHCIQLEDRKGKLKGLYRIYQLRKVFQESDANTVIPFLPIVSLYALVANIGVGKRMILSERADPYTKIFAKNLSTKDVIGNFLMRKIGIYNMADWMVFQTPDAQSYFNKSLQKKSCIIPNPLDTEHLPTRYEGIRDRCIVAAGRFSHEKNFPMLIKAFAVFHETHPMYRLTIYGDGSLRNEYSKLIRDLEIEESVDMPGYIDNLAETIRNKAMYISTSNHEGISNSMLEALGMGIPTIVTDCPVGGARMFVETDINGILIPMEDIQALVKAMSKIADDDEYAQRLSRSATEIRDTISARKICEQWLELM